MPNFDTGHYFLTTMAPVKTGSMTDANGEVISYAQNLRRILSVLPTALQSPATEKIGINSPFSRERSTHLCRYMVLDDLTYNGRIAQDPIIGALKGEDPIKPQEVDHLNCPYLMFTVDFDAVLAIGDELPNTLSLQQQDDVRDAYARRLWETMEEEVREIYSNCYGFDGVNSGDEFAAYIKSVQIETTMPFNDYWFDPPVLHPLPQGKIAIITIPPIGLFLLGLLGLIMGHDATPLLSFLVDIKPIWSVIAGLIATIIAIWIDYRIVMTNGEKPMSAGRYADLPNVLKSLYVQQKFSDFVIDHQGADAESLHKAFGEFVNAHHPENKMEITQRPGVVSADRPNGTIPLEQ